MFRGGLSVWASLRLCPAFYHAGPRPLYFPPQLGFHFGSQENINMNLSRSFRTGLLALAAMAVTHVSAVAESGTISIRSLKAGFGIGG